MEQICSLCHAVIDQDLEAERCPACGSEIVDNPALEVGEYSGPPPEVDHRGIMLPRRHSLGGIITPQ
jgi:uncharacterized protein with PIN domain